MLPTKVKMRLIRGLFSALALCFAVGAVSCVNSPFEPIVTEQDPDRDPDEDGGPSTGFLLEDGGTLLAVHFVYESARPG